MKLAINYSHQVAALLAENRIRLDRFKCPDWPDLVDEASHYCPVAVHFDLQAGNGSVEHDKDWQKIDHLLEQTATPYVNLHLNAKQEDLPGYAGEPFSDEQTHIPGSSMCRPG